MGILDTISGSNVSLLRRIKLFTSPGLEKSLINELDKLSVSTKIESSGKSYVDLSATLDDIWTIILRRICEEVHMHICDPFMARERRALIRALNASNWGSFIPFSVHLPKPYVKVICKESQLYHTGMIENFVQEVIKRHCHKSVQLQGDDLPDIMKKRGCLPISPKITIKIQNDICEVLANTSGDLTQRPWYKISEFEDRLKCTAAASIAQDVISALVANDKDEVTIWDPFCHNGSLLMEMHSYFTDGCIRPKDIVYPLSNFPLNSPQSYDGVISSIPRVPYSINLNLIGTDEDAKYIQCASDVLQYALANNEEYFKIQFKCQPINKVNIECNKLIILSNLYYGDKERRSEFLKGYKKFLAYLKTLTKNRKFEAYVIAPKSFKRISGLKWETMLKFNNNGTLVELIKLLH